MADSILRLRVESTEYDSKLKKASQGLQHYIDNCRKVGGTLAVVEDNTLAFVRALGDMPTIAQGGTQSLREMTKSLTDLTLQYRSLTDEEKDSPFGQAMAQSIQTLIERAGQARDALGDVNAAIGNAASDTRVFDQIAGAAGLTTAAFQTLQGASKLLGIDLGDNVEVIARLQAAMAVTNGLTQIQNTLQKESAVMQGVAALQTKAHAAAQALLAKNTTMATAAGKAFNAVANANPYVLIASAVIAASTALVAFSRNSKEATDTMKANQDAVERSKKAIESYRQTFANSYADLMARYDKLKRAWLSLGDTHQKQQWIKDNEKAFADLGLSINNLQSAEDAFENNTGKVVDSFKRRAQAAALAAKMVDLYKQQIELQQQASDRAQSIKVNPYHTFVARENEPAEGFIPDAEPDKYGRTTYNQGRYTRIGNSTRFVYTPQGAEEFNKNLAEIDPVLKQLKKDYQYNDTLLQKYNNSLSQLETGQTLTTITPDNKEKPAPVGSIADLTQKMQELKNIQSLVTDNAEWVRYQQQIEQIQYQIDAIKGTWKEGLQATFTITTDDTEVLSALSDIQGATVADRTVVIQSDTAEAYNQIVELTKNIEGTTVSFKVKPEVDRELGRSITTSSGLNDFISGLKKEIQDADFGSDLYNALNAKLADATMLQNLVKESLSVGLGTALFDIADENGQDFWDRILNPEGVENADWQAIADAINRKRKEMGLDALTLDYETGSVSKSSTIESTDSIQKMTSGMSQVSSGLTQLGIKLPEGVNKLVSSMQGVTSIIQGVQTLLSVFGSSTMSVEIASQNANTSALMANTSALIANSASNNTDAVIEGVKGVMSMFSGGAAGKHNGGIVHAATGAIVPGHHFSGDNVPALLDSGELVLNRAQQGNLASQLEGGGSETATPLRPYVSGQDVFLGTNNYLRGAGLGEIVTTRMLQRMGLM